jgi:hypothetical protein
VKNFWLAHHGEVLQVGSVVISNHFSLLFCRRRRVSFRKASLVPFHSRQDQGAIEVSFRVVMSAVAQVGASRRGTRGEYG